MRKKHTPKVRKKYDKNRFSHTLREDLLATTFFYHGSVFDSIGPLCGNFKYPLSNAQATKIMSQKNKWSVVLLLFCENAYEFYIKTKIIKYHEKHLTREQLGARLDADQLTFVNSVNIDHVCSTGYFIVPDPNANVEENLSAIKQLFEKENPFSYTVAVLTAMEREKKLKALEEMKEKAA